MTKKLVFSNEKAQALDAHIAGGCLLPSQMNWPVDAEGNPQLHLLTIPLSWIAKDLAGWVSVFTPYSLNDTYLHWESLITDSENRSQAIIHNNDGPLRNEYLRELSSAKRVFLEETNKSDSDKNFESKIHGVPAWLQDEDSIPDHHCILAIRGEDVDLGFPEEPGMFSDGMIYLFLKNGFDSCSHPSTQGCITFQFT